MHECPYCGSDLRGSGTVRRTRSSGARKTGSPGRKDTEAAEVSCPDCDGVIDGFSPH
jgi:DNA-directed RNA polymerase subunit RPC12/RpoP